MKMIVVVLSLSLPMFVEPLFAQSPSVKFDDLNGEYEEAWGEWRKKDIAARRAKASAEELKAIRALGRRS